MSEPAPYHDKSVVICPSCGGVGLKWLMDNRVRCRRCKGSGCIFVPNKIKPPKNP